MNGLAQKILAIVEGNAAVCAALLDLFIDALAGYEAQYVALQAELDALQATLADDTERLDTLELIIYDEGYEPAIAA